MKKSMSGKSILLFLAVLCIYQVVIAQTVETVITFSEDDLFVTKSNGFDLVQIDSSRSWLDGAEGEPMLPVVTANIALPAGAVITNVRTIVEEEAELEGNFKIMPTQKVVPSSSTDKVEFVRPNQNIYNSSKRQREKAVDGHSRKIMRGHYLAGVKLHPLDYIPAEGKLILRKKIRVYVDYSIEAKKAIRPWKKNVQFEKMIRESVLNPEALSSSNEETQLENSILSSSPASGETLLMAPPGNVVEYLIITKSEFADEFQVLADWKTKKGVPAEVVTLDWIYANYSGPNRQYQIKSCIRDYAINKGTLYAALGSDIDGAVDYDCYTTCGEYTLYNMPTDLYYSDIDVMNWNGDGDSRNGELEDGVDMAPDVFVGRISVSSEAEATAYINKALTYEKNPPLDNFSQKFLMSGILLWGTLGGVSDAEAKSEVMWEDYIGPCWGGTKYRLYDTNTDFEGGPSYNAIPANINEQISNGYNFMHMSTHGNTNLWSTEGGGIYSTSDVAFLTNAGKYINIATIACITNAFDDDYWPCLGEAFTRKADGGAVSYIGSSDFGWGYAGTSYPGPSLQYDQMFYNYLFNNTYGNHLGEVFARMKESKLPISSYGADHWLQYGINLLGDPELPLYTANPGTITPTYSSQIEMGLQTFYVTTDIGGSKVCLYKENDVYVYGTDVHGTFQAQINPVHPGYMDVTITVPNRIPYEGVVAVGAVDSIPPGSPADLTATAGLNQINLDWADNNEPDLMKYNVYRATSIEGPYTKIGSVQTSSFEDKNVYGLTYYYQVAAVDYSRNESDYSIASAAPQDTIAPATVQRFYANPGHLSVYTGWAANIELDLLHYNLYRSVNYGAFEQIAEVNGISYKDMDVVLGNFYNYYMTAEDVQGNQSPASAQSGASPTQHLVASNLRAVAGDAQVALEWDFEEDPNQLWFFVVERSITSGSGYQICNMLSDTNMIDDLVANGTTYYYHVSAVNLEGYGGPWSNEVSATPHGSINPEAPAPPINLFAVAGDMRVSLNWDDSNEADFSHYNVRRSTIDGCCWKAIALNVTSSSYTDSNGLYNGVTYYYVVTAVDINGNESWPSNQASATPADVPPATPTGLVAVAGEGLVSLDWNDNNEADLRGYDVYRSTTSGSGYQPVAMYLTDSSFVDTYVTGGVTYYYVVAALDIGGRESFYSDEVSATPADGRPAAPTGLTATAGDGMVSLNWNDNTEPDLRGYNVFRSTTSGSGYEIIEMYLTQSSFVDNTAVNGTTYYYVVAAMDTLGAQSPYSNEASATPVDLTPPAAPTGLTATAGISQVVLNWNDNTESDFSYYIVSRSTTSGGPYSPIAADLTVSAYTDNNVVNGTTYYYVVKAVDTATNQSDYSAQASATPQAPAPVTYFPSSYTINAGSLYSGTLAGLTANDNSYLVIRSQTSGTTRYARTDFTVTAISGTASRIDLQVIAKSSNSSTTLKIYLYNFTTSTWEQKNSGTIGTSEVTRNIAITSGMSNYISGGQLRIRTEGYKTNRTTIRLSHEVVSAKITQ